MPTASGILVENGSTVTGARKRPEARLPAAYGLLRIRQRMASVQHVVTRAEWYVAELDKVPEGEAAAAADFSSNSRPDSEI
jgi:hypothetical protein